MCGLASFSFGRASLPGCSCAMYVVSDAVADVLLEICWGVVVLPRARPAEEGPVLGGRDAECFLFEDPSVSDVSVGQEAEVCFVARVRSFRLATIDLDFGRVAVRAGQEGLDLAVWKREGGVCEARSVQVKGAARDVDESVGVTRVG